MRAMYLQVKNAGSRPTIFSAQTDFFHKAKVLQPNPKRILFQTCQQFISCLRSKEELPVGDPQDLNPAVPRAQQTPSPAFRARQGPVPNPAASPSSSQEAEILQVFSKPSTAPGSPRKRPLRIWSKTSTMKVTRLLTTPPVYFSQDSYVRVDDSHPRLSSATDVNLRRRCSCERSGLQTRSQHLQEDHKPLTLSLLCPDKFLYAHSLSHCTFHYSDF